MVKIEIPGFSNVTKGLAEVALSDRQLAFNTDNKTLYIKYNNTLYPISATPDNINVRFNYNNELSLDEDLSLKSIQVSPDGNCTVKSVILGENCITTNKSIVLLMEYSTTENYGMSGLIYRLGANVSGSYHISLESNGKFSIEGATTVAEKAKVVTAELGGKKYVGIQFGNAETSTLYFHGFDTRPTNPPDFTTYRDSNLTNVEEQKNE